MSCYYLLVPSLSMIVLDRYSNTRLPHCILSPGCFEIGSDLSCTECVENYLYDQNTRRCEKICLQGDGLERDDNCIQNAPTTTQPVSAKAAGSLTETPTDVTIQLTGKTVPTFSVTSSMTSYPAKTEGGTINKGSSASIAIGVGIAGGFAALLISALLLIVFCYRGSCCPNNQQLSLGMTTSYHYTV